MTAFIFAIIIVAAIGVIAGLILAIASIIMHVPTDEKAAAIEEIPYPVLHKITARIISEVEGINRVVYDLTPKPTGTIEWE